MAQTYVIGGGTDPTKVITPNVQQAVDPMYLAARIALRPLDYTGAGKILGHYAVAQRSGEVAATLAAAAHLARIRWAPSDGASFLVLKRIKAGLSFSAAVTTAVEMTLRAIIARGFSIDFTTNMTAISMAGIPNTNAMRKTMGSSLMGVNGPGICTTAAMSGQTLTADAAPFAITPFSTLLPVTATGTAVAIPVGAATPMATLYEYTALSQHPVVLSSNEGVLVQSHLAGPASGTFGVYCQWEWAEVVVY